MYYTFHVSNLGEITKDATLGWFWVCRIDYQANKKVDTYSVKVNSITLTSKRYKKEPKEVQEDDSLPESSSKAVAILKSNTNH